MSDYDELMFLKTEVAELKTRVETIERFIMRMLDRIVELERDRRAREAERDLDDEGPKP
jgi:hypothetical protein